MADQNVRGRFVWHELETPNSESAHEFYSDVLGWRKESFEQDPSYAMFGAPSGPLGGFVALRDDQPRWLPYIGTDDIDATLAEANRLGAAVLQDVTEIPNGSKFAILADPDGARFAVYASGGEPEPEKTAAERGEFSWHELAAKDFRAAFDFYSRLFGWENLSEYDMGPAGVYLIFGRNGQRLGGMFTKGSEAGLPDDAYWLGYVRVPNVLEAANAVKSRGGSVAVEPMEVPGGDWIAQCVDPHGALFAVQTTAEDMQASRTQATPASRTPAADEGTAPSTAGIASSIEAFDGGSSEEAASPTEPAKKPSAKKPSAKKASAKKASAKKPSGKKPSGKKPSAKKAPAKRAAAKKAAAKKAPAAKKTAKKAAKKTAAKKTAKKTAKKAAKKKAGAASKAGTRKAAKKKSNKKAGAKKAAKKKPATKKPATKKKRAGASQGRGGAKRKTSKASKASKASKKAGRKKAGRKGRR